ncbi:MAG: amidohydrolase family protein [Phycisphaerales bacterium]
MPTDNHHFPLDAARAVPARPARPENRFGLDYARAAGLLPPPPTPIVDIHTHLNGPRALAIYRRVAAMYGVTRALTMVRLAECGIVRAALGDSVHFIAFPDFRSPDRRRAFTEGFLADIQAFHDQFGSRMIKLWNAPRVYEMFPGPEGRALVAIDGEWRVRQVELARSLKMGVMVHLTDPDTWFATKYADTGVYPPKRGQYQGLERLLDRFSDVPFLGAHMGGYAEDLDFLDGLLTRHPNYHIDTSATKWVVRELSRHPRSRVVEFFDKWKHRICFGSDIVTTDEHLAPTPATPAPAAPAPGFNAGAPAVARHPMADLAESEETAFDLYASRYFALRMMFDTAYDGESPIADPDLRMVDPSIKDPLAAPRLQGLSLPEPLRRELYHGAATRLLAQMGLQV